MTTNSILNEINESEELTETQIPRSKNFEKNLKSIEKTRRRVASANINLIIKQNDEVNNLFNQQFRNAEATMLRFHNLQRARLLKQQFQKMTIKIQVFKNDFIEFESFETLSLKNVDAQSASAQLTIFEKSNATVAVDALLSQIILSFKLKIIKFEKMKIYKNQSENEHQRWFRDVKIKMMNVSKYFIIDKVKIL